MSLDYYDILGLKRDCTPDEIARCYRTLSLKWHPKLSKEDPKTAFHHFSQIAESYEVLSCRNIHIISLKSNDFNKSYKKSIF